MKIKGLEIDIDIPALNGEGEDGFGNKAPPADTLYVCMFTDAHFDAIEFPQKFPGIPYEWISEDNCWVIIKEVRLSDLVKDEIEHERGADGVLSETGKESAARLSESFSALAKELAEMAEG